jgi:hypothetical protein
MNWKIHTICSFVAIILASAVSAQDQGMTGKTHSANIGKILWAKERILKDRQDQIKYETVFNSNDSLYGRVFLAKSLERLGVEENGGKCKNPEGAYRLKMFVDGESKGVLNEQRVEEPTWTTFQIGLNLSAGDSGDRQNIGVPEKWKAAVQALPDKSYKVKMEIWGGRKDCELKYAEGEFALNKTGGSMVSMGTLPEAKMVNPALEQEMVSAVKGQGWTNEGPTKVVIIEPEWRLIRDAFNNITDREINTHTILKSTKDGSCRANDISFRQPHLGSNKFGSTQFYGLGLKSYPVQCQ